LICLILSLIFCFNTALAKRGNNLEADSIYVAGQMILQFNSSVQLNKGLTSTPYLDSLNQVFSVQAFGPFYYMDDSTDMALFQELGMDRIYLYIFPDTLDMLYVSEQYKMSPAVKWAEPNYIAYVDYTPPDDYFHLQWGLHNIGQPPFYGYGGADIDASRAWDINDNVMPQMKIAIIDTGIDSLNWDLYTQIWHNPIDNTIDRVNQDHNYFVIPQYPNDTCYLVDDIWGWNFEDVGLYGYCGNNSPHPYKTPIEGYLAGFHGTAVSGVAGASAFTEKPSQPLAGKIDALGIVGVNWNSKLMSLKGCNDYGSCPATACGFAIQYAADKGADVINMSFGGPYSVFRDSIMIAYAFGRGCVLVAAMGNCGPVCDTVRYPAACDSFVIAVGATDWFDNRWYYNSHAGSSAGRHIDVVAPGESIFTDTWGIWPTERDSFDYFTGTSLATPFVSGEVALIKGQYKKLFPYWPFTNKQLMDIIRWTAEDSMYYPVSDTTWDDSLHGYGRINAFRGMLAVSRGEVNNDHSITVADVTYLVNYIFKGGPPPIPVRGIGDANCNGNVNVSDVVYLNYYLFQGGPKPPLCFRWNY